MGWQEWPLILFTVTAQAATGAFWWCCFAILAGDLVLERRLRLKSLMVVVWGMLALGFAFSICHLGSPLYAINAIFRFGRSPLLNEVTFGGAFAALMLPTVPTWNTPLTVIGRGLVVYVPGEIEFNAAAKTVGPRAFHSQPNCSPLLGTRRTVRRIETRSG